MGIPHQFLPANRVPNKELTKSGPDVCLLVKLLNRFRRHATFHTFS